MTRRLLLLGVVLLFAASIPWYRSAEAPVTIWLGLPDWVTVALGCYGAAAALNAWAWLATDIRDPEPGIREPEPEIGDPESPEESAAAGKPHAEGPR